MWKSNGVTTKLLDTPIELSHWWSWCVEVSAGMNYIKLYTLTNSKQAIMRAKSLGMPSWLCASQEKKSPPELLPRCRLWKPPGSSKSHQIVGRREKKNNEARITWVNQVHGLWEMSRVIFDLGDSAADGCSHWSSPLKVLSPLHVVAAIDAIAAPQAQITTCTTNSINLDIDTMVLVDKYVQGSERISTPSLHLLPSGFSAGHRAPANHTHEKCRTPICHEFKAYIGIGSQHWHWILTKLLELWNVDMSSGQLSM